MRKKTAQLSGYYKVRYLVLQYIPFLSLILKPMRRIEFYSFHIIFLVENLLNKETEASKNPAIIYNNQPSTHFIFTHTLFRGEHTE